MERRRKHIHRTVSDYTGKIDCITICSISNNKHYEFLIQVEFTMIMTLVLDKHLTLTLAAQTTMEHNAHLIL
jgi:hypothetical protein